MIVGKTNFILKAKVNKDLLDNNIIWREREERSKIFKHLRADFNKTSDHNKILKVIRHGMSI